MHLHKSYCFYKNRRECSFKNELYIAGGDLKSFLFGMKNIYGGEKSMWPNVMSNQMQANQTNYLNNYPTNYSNTLTNNSLSNSIYNNHLTNNLTNSFTNNYNIPTFNYNNTQTTNNYTVINNNIYTGGMQTMQPQTMGGFPQMMGQQQMMMGGQFPMMAQQQMMGYPQQMMGQQQMMGYPQQMMPQQQMMPTMGYPQMMPQQQMMPTMGYPQMMGQQQMMDPFSQMMNPFSFGSQFGNPFQSDPMSSLTSLIDYLLSLIGGTGLEEPLIEDEVVFGDELNGAWGDPHFDFTDPNGNKATIDHKGADGETYNILNADGLDIDAEYKKWDDSENPQVMGAVRVGAGNQELLLNEGKVTLNGRELAKGTTGTLQDGRKVEILDNGSVTLHAKDGEGEINIVNKDGYYNIDPVGKEIGINTGIDAGGILGLLATLGKAQTKEQIIADYDTNKNGILDDGDTKIGDEFKANKDIGKYKY